MLLLKAVRCSRRGLRIASALILFGTALHFAWLLVPAFDDQAAVVAVACAGVADSVVGFAPDRTGAWPGCWRVVMPNEEMGGRAMPQPPDVATSIVITAAAGFLAFVMRNDDRAVFLS